MWSEVLVIQLYTTLCKPRELNLLKQEMTNVNTDILEINELTWTEMGELNSDDHYIYYCVQESFGRNGVALIVNKRVQNAVLGCNLKNFKNLKNDLGSFPRQSIQYHSNPSLCPKHWCQRRGRWIVLWRPIRPPRTNTKTKMPFSILGTRMQM